MQTRPAPPPAPAPPPEQLAALKGWLDGRPDREQLQPIGIQRILLESNALARLPDLLRELDAPARTLLVQDDTPMRRGPAALKPLVRDLLVGAGRAVEPCVLQPAEDGLVHADLPNADRLRRAIGDEPTAIIALGAGSVCDVAKYARLAAEQDGNPRTMLVLVPTAASVTAFTSNLAILLKDGVKRTFPGGFPDAVVCDLETLADAPLAMTLAGLGDCCARFVSYGDWYLSHQLGLVELYSETPLALMGEDLDRQYLAAAPAIGRRTEEGLAFLTRQVLLAGLAQSVVNMSAPLSGTEHVVSHVLDMGAAAWGRPLALHGAQVGVATPLAIRVYERLLERFDPARPRPAPPDPAAVETRIRAAFQPLDPSGRMAAECWQDYRQKLARWAAQPEPFDAVRARWADEIAPRLRQLVRPSATVCDILARAGHPLRFEDLEPPIPREQARFALRHAHLIRKRFTAGDLFEWLDLGWDTLAEELSS